MNRVKANVSDMQRLRMFSQRSAALGVVVWVLLSLTVTTDSHETELIHKIVFFAVLVIVPLGLSLVMAGDQTGSIGLYRAAVLVQPIAAIMTVASFFVEKGTLSAALSVAWLVFSALVALFGVTGLISRGLYPLQESSIEAGLLYLPVAGVWLVVYRLGVQPFDYGETIILLTVVHFHFAGFAAPIIAGMTGRMLARSAHPPARIYLFTVVAIVAAIPLVAAGITFSPWLGLIGTVLLSLGLLMLAVLTVSRVIPAIPALGTRVLLLIAALSSCTAMVLACLYAYSLVAHIVILRIPTMALSHGLLNAFGFATCSLLAWSTISAKDFPG
ncbi:MAG TPA: YndJ family protein [Pyrinomonadaceae bacterium]|nr:YndJ family protein [Pyrinomonadaceae bacterium]